MNKNTKKGQQEKISVIIPCYNTELYVRKCIESAIRQTYKNLEIILVDDGSTDSTGRICDDYAKKDPRIIVIHKENGGQSSARNMGLDIATGDYIAFIDSDDWISAHTFEYLLYLIKKYNVRASVSCCIRAYENRGKISYSKKVTIEDKLCDSDEMMKRLLLNGGGPVNKLFHRDDIGSLRFIEGVTNEDEPFLLELYSNIPSFVIGGHQTYAYRKRRNSTTTSVFSRKNLDFYYNSAQNIEFVKNVRPQLLDYAKDRHYKAAIYCYAKLLFHLKGSEGDRYRKEIREELHKNRNDIFHSKYLPFIFKIMGIAFSII